MRDFLKEYLKNEYTGNLIKDFCRYWINYGENEPKPYDSWEEKNTYRSKNDLDCICFGGDLRADTLMSAWTVMKWVADYLNKDKPKRITFNKKTNYSKDPYWCVRLLMEKTEEYLPSEHELVQLLLRFLNLAKRPCNFILLPDKNMNCERYNCNIHGQTVRLFDEVPATLYYIFDKEALGRYFLTDARDAVDVEKVRDWIREEKLDVGFEDKVIDPSRIIPIMEGVHPKDPLEAQTEKEIRAVLSYMISILEARREALHEER
ncbi:MAG: hypothetical protein IK020_10990 [Clostridiales bacterium]|nr:hypothetical protein [Clostridiales bacterium]